MNALQRGVVGVGLCLLVMLALVPPWDTAEGVTYHWIFAAPRRSHVSAVLSVVPMLVVLVVTRCLYQMAARPPAQPLPPMSGPDNPPSSHTVLKAIQRLRSLRQDPGSFRQGGKP